MFFDNNNNSINYHQHIHNHKFLLKNYHSSIMSYIDNSNTCFVPFTLNFLITYTKATSDKDDDIYDNDNIKYKIMGDKHFGHAVSVLLYKIIIKCICISLIIMH